VIRLLTGTDPTASIARCEYTDVRHFRDSPDRGGSEIQETKSPMDWLALHKGDVIIGCACLMRCSAARARCRNLFVETEFRGNGYGAALVMFQVRHARNIGYRVIDAYSWSFALFERCGFVAKKQYKIGTRYYVRETH
jgi:N-acetylglutamate synthase-like GNAT family acetyltransferase